MTVENLITDKQIDIAFAHANFGDRSKRDVVRFALMKTAHGYYNGHTADSIITELGLKQNEHLTELGVRYLFAAFPEYPANLKGY